MSQWYPAGKDAVLRGQVNFEADTIIAVPMSGYTFDATDASVADVAGTAVADGVTVTGIAVADGVVTCDPVVFAAVGGTDHLTSIVVFAAGGDGTLLAFIDRRADTVPLDVEPNGVDITFTFANHLVRI